VLTDATGDRLLLRSAKTGLAADFALAVTTDADGNAADALGLSRLVVGSTTSQVAADAKATVNGIAVTSATNSFASTVPGVTFNALKLTTAPVELTVTQDNSAATDNINAFVKAYNDINQLLGEATKFDAATKAAGLLQGDTTAITLQNTLRNAIQSVSTASTAFTRLTDLGITQQRGGDLVVDSTKLSAAMGNMSELKKFFQNSGGTTAADGVAVKIKAFTTGLLAVNGFFNTKDSSLKLSLTRNGKDQDRVNEKATKLETSLNARYSALDAKMSSLNALSAYMSQQVTNWNKSTN
jgi:flagellar hook-associated protein 2